MSQALRGCYAQPRSEIGVWGPRPQRVQGSALAFPYELANGPPSLAQ